MQNRLVRNLVIGVGATLAATQAQATLIGSSPCGGPRLECAGSSDPRSSPPLR
jgi:hypothetical protein